MVLITEFGGDSEEGIANFAGELTFILSSDDIAYIYFIANAFAYRFIDYDNLQSVSYLILQYIATFYNNHRLHSYLEYKSPNQYEAQAEKMKNVVQLCVWNLLTMSSSSLIFRVSCNYSVRFI